MIPSDICYNITGSHWHICIFPPISIITYIDRITRNPYASFYEFDFRNTFYPVLKTSKREIKNNNLP